MKIVRVDWVDITSYNKWANHGEACKLSPTNISEVGWLVSRDKQHIRVCMSNCGDGDLGFIKVIPMGVVKKVVVIK